MYIYYIYIYRCRVNAVRKSREPSGRMSVRAAFNIYLSYNMTYINYYSDTITVTTVNSSAESPRFIRVVMYTVYIYNMLDTCTPWVCLQQFIEFEDRERKKQTTE